MKIVILDAKTITNSDVSLKPIEYIGEVVTYQLTSYDRIKDRIADADAVLCNKSVLDEHNLSFAKKLKYIGLFATGYNNIDIDYCSKHNITVCNAGSYSTDAVAQHTFALILEIFSNVAKYDRFCHDGGWQKSDTFSPFVFSLTELSGKTIGIVGFGAIGRAVAKIALAFNMNVLVYTRTKKQCDNVTFTDFDTLLSESDIVTVHCPLNDASENMFNEQAFLKMKQGAVFINTARGGVMDEQALVCALSNGPLAYAAIDVLSSEPMSIDSQLVHIDNLIITPHIAWAPKETRIRLIDIVADNLTSFINGEPKNVVNHSL